MNDIDHFEFHYRCCPTVKLLNLLVLDLTNGGISGSLAGKGRIDDKLIKAYNDNNLLISTSSTYLVKEEEHVLLISLEPIAIS